MGVCEDCKAADAALTIRKRNFCGPCFMNFANIKASRRMENYRSKNIGAGPKAQLLVPVSLGVSSTILLHVLDSLQERQLKSQGRTLYDLHIVNVNLSTADTSGAHGLEALQEVYSRHKYTTIPFSSIFQYDNEIGSVISELSSSGFEDAPSKTDQERLDAFISAHSSATSRTDIEYTLLMRLIVAFAKDQGCTGILWGHSDSRLAGRVLADVAKGRGLSLPSQISEGISPSGLRYNFPLRDLLKTELEAYASLLPERVSQSIIPDRTIADMPSTTKNMSIEDLMSQYIETQGAKYPSIMANVVRTVNKLNPPAVQEPGIKCALCQMPMEEASEGLSMPGDPQVSNGNAESSTKRRNYCYGCARSCLDMEQAERP
ncbi:cytoplasmic tRNA 2-thiolation protein 2 [Arachnomyces sp. PD_36]|nr:cytoplasmic tRNA 2-thiolation protein 2 [Arachnomyces sp. PD_36]